MQFENRPQHLTINKQAHESQLTLRNVSILAKAWGLGDNQALSLIGVSSDRLKDQGAVGSQALLLSKEEVETASYLLALHSFLERAITDSVSISEWVKTPLAEDSPAMGKPPLDYILGHPSKLFAARALHQWLNINL